MGLSRNVEHSHSRWQDPIPEDCKGRRENVPRGRLDLSLPRVAATLATAAALGWHCTWPPTARVPATSCAKAAVARSRHGGGVHQSRRWRHSGEMVVIVSFWQDTVVEP